MRHYSMLRGRISEIFAIGLLVACSAYAAAPVNTQPASGLNTRPGDAGEILFNENWKFHGGDDAAASALDFNDRDWRSLDVPHDWSVESAFDPKLASCTAFLPCGIAWYRKSFVLPPDAKDKSVRIRFDGVSNHSTVWCNGQLMGGRPYGYSSFSFDLTPNLHFDGRDNVISVRVDHEKYADSRWYAGSGIYRNVFLTIANKIHIDTDGTFVTTPQVSSDRARMDFATMVRNDTQSPAEVTAVTTVKDPSGNIVATLEDKNSVNPGANQLLEATGALPSPVLWSPEHPFLYTAVTSLHKRDKLLDEYTTRFGVRTFTFDPAKGFSINGQTMKLKGVCLHHDAGALGAAVPIEVWERRLKTLQQAGCNAIRCSHNPPAPEFLDLCDQMGFLVMDEAFDEWTRGKKKWVVGHNVGEPSYDGYHTDFDKWADTDIKDMVRRDRNHPSIILWSIGNEIDYQNDPYPPNSPELPPIASRLIKDLKSMDPTRPVTAACAFPETNLYKQLLDVEGYNYMEHLYAGDHEAHPDRVLYGSENSHALAAWESVVSDDYIAGQFLWTGIDYLGEAGVWPSHASGAGLLDLAGFKKDQFYFRQSLWIDKPVVYLTTDGRVGRRSQSQVATTPSPMITCFTNCDRVELFHDGVSLGEKVQTPQHIITWPLAFTSGQLKAVGHRGNAQVSCELKHAGPAAKIELKSDVQSLTAVRRSLAQIELDITDADGNVVPQGTSTVTCAISGPGHLRGIESGDINNSSQSYNVNSKNTFHGRLMIYVQAAGTAGQISLIVTAPTLKSSQIVVTVN